MALSDGWRERIANQPITAASRMGPNGGALAAAAAPPMASVQPLAPAAGAEPALVAINGIRVAPVLVPYVQALRDAARRLGASFSLTSGYRSAADQAALRLRWEAGDPSVVYPPAAHSYHESGLAVDIESNQLDALGSFAESIGMRWGGRFGDPVHFDLGRR